jgi:hypothetical protein
MVEAGWFRVADAQGLDLDGVRHLVTREMGGACAVRVVGARPSADALAFWKQVGEALGRNAGLIEDSTSGELTADSGEWMDVRFEPDRLDAYRHAKVGQPLHTDGAYVARQDAREIALFYMARQAEAGGESLIVAADTIDRCAASRDPGLHQRLTNLAIKFGKNSGDPRVTTILRREAGRLKINWNYFRVLPDQGDDAARLREDFRAFLEDMVRRGDVMTFRLDSGDALFFKDDEVMHGRAAFEAARSGDRLLWKTYFTTSSAEARAVA